MARVNQRLFLVWDSEAETIQGSVMVAVNEVVAKRAFVAAIEGEKAFPFPEAMRLLLVGEITDYGEITPFNPSIVVTGSEVVQTLKDNAR
ncbi:MAG: DNA binding protein [Microviridae sp.]|nr:MAG: DNA binding protein [Microviridae sp.]